MSMTHDEMIAVIAAHKDGKTVQVRCKGSDREWGYTSGPYWNFADCDYRIKPEPLEYWVNTYKNSVYNALHPTEDSAKAAANEDTIRIAVHMKEVES
jgi:hypothetical protein